MFRPCVRWSGTDACQEPESGGAVPEVASGGLSDGGKAVENSALKARIEPGIPVVMAADAERRFARGGAGAFDSADVERICDHRPIGCLKRLIHKAFRVAGKQRSECG